MKTITFAIPCFNSAAYLGKCVDSLLPAGDDIEIILINDGSTDDTPYICDLYALKYPAVIKVIHQENGGHGEGINQGLRHASGLYFKIVDSDDWADEKALHKVMALLRCFSHQQIYIDLLIANYAYENVNRKKSKSINYRCTFPVGRIFGWDDIKRFRASNYLLMHSAFYRTELLRDCGLQLPKHTFYIDNLVVYKPLPYVKTMYYLDVDFYRYYIGRVDQSVNEAVMISRIDQQIAVTKNILHSYDLKDLAKKEPKLAKYMFHYLSMMVIICSVFLMLGNTPEYLKKHAALWDYIKEFDKLLYNKLKYGSLSAFAASQNWFGRLIAIIAYKVVKWIYKFN